jgi:hypothetical protein
MGFAFTFTLEAEDGTRFDPPTLKTRTGLASQRHDPAGKRKDAPGDRRPSRRGRR